MSSETATLQLSCKRSSINDITNRTHYYLDQNDIAVVDADASCIYFLALFAPTSWLPWLASDGFYRQIFGATFMEVRVLYRIWDAISLSCFYHILLIYRVQLRTI